MSFLRLLVLLPALYLGLLGQGHGWVLCQAACGCVCLELEGMCNCADPAEHEAGCAQAASHQVAENCKGDKGADTCQDTALDPGHYVVEKAPQYPNLDFFMAGCLLPTPSVQVVVTGADCSPRLARGPPGEVLAPPQVLLCLRGIVMLV